jgi:hypothetical protein
MDPKESAQELIAGIKRLKEELREREQSLPAHTIRPHQLLAIEDLENRIAQLEEKLKLSKSTASSD